MNARTTKVARTAAVFVALLMAIPATAAVANEITAAGSPPSVTSTDASAEQTRSAPARARRGAKARRPAKPRRAARARKVCSGRGRARRCVIVGATAPAPAPSAAPAAAPAPAPASEALAAGGGDPGAFGFLFPNGANPGRWNPCAPVRYSINANRAPAGGVADVQEAIRRLGSATGINFVYDGPTSEVPNNGANGYNGTRTVIAWATPAESNMLTGNAAGVGGAAAVSSNGYIRITRGFVVIDANRSVPAGFGGGATQGSLLLHELGHMVGLDHTGDQGQIMYPTVTSRTPADWGAGDRNGLHRVGAANGCLA